MKSSEIRNRLIALVGDSEACDLLETPNAELGGLTPQDLLDAGNIEPVQTLLQTLEIRERARILWISAQNHEPLAIESLLSSDQLRGRGKV